MKELWDKLESYKTSLGFLAIGLIGILAKLEWLDSDTVEWLLLIVGPATGLSFAAKANRANAAIKKVESDVKAIKSNGGGNA